MPERMPPGVGDTGRAVLSCGFGGRTRNLPESPERVTSDLPAAEQFVDAALRCADLLTAMERSGVGAPDEIIADGKIHRFRGEGDKPGRKDAWYVVYPGYYPTGVFGSWRIGHREVWRPEAVNVLSAAEQADQRRQAREAGARGAEARFAEQTRVAAQAWADWNAARTPDFDHRYLRRKGVFPYGVLQAGTGLLVPLSDDNGRLWNLQTIFPDGTKRFRPGGRVAGLFVAIGSSDDLTTVVVCEGWATAVTIHDASGLPVLAAMNAGNLDRVARTARRQWPDAAIVLAADNDHETVGNPGMTKARAAALASGAVVVAPPTLPGCTDFNDVGLAVTREAFARAGLPASGRCKGRATPPNRPAPNNSGPAVAFSEDVR